MNMYLKIIGLFALWVPLLNAMEAEQVPEKNLDRKVAALRQAYKASRSASFNVVRERSTVPVNSQQANATEIALKFLSFSIKQLSEEHLKPLSRSGSAEDDEKKEEKQN